MQATFASGTCKGRLHHPSRVRRGRPWRCGPLRPAAPRTAYVEHRGEHLARLEASRDINTARPLSLAHNGGVWAPEVRAKRQANARARRGRDLTPAEAGQLRGDLVDLARWASRARANTAGGVIIIGIGEDKSARAATAPGVDITDVEMSRIRQIVAAGVSPMPAFDLLPVVDGDSDPLAPHGFVLIAVPRSPLAPHAVLINESSASNGWLVVLSGYACSPSAGAAGSRWGVWFWRLLRLLWVGRPLGWHPGVARVRSRGSRRHGDVLLRRDRASGTRRDRPEAHVLTPPRLRAHSASSDDARSIPERCARSTGVAGCARALEP